MTPRTSLLTSLTTKGVFAFTLLCSTFTARAYAQVNFPEVEPNDSNAASNIVSCIANNDTITGFDVFSTKGSSPAFTTAEASILAPYLRQALAKASPKDMATFYALTRDITKGELVTSGGMFVRGRYLYVILANAKTSPYSNQYENAHTVDTRDRPLIPISRYRFTATFTPESAWIPNKQVRGDDGYDRYLDESKLVVIDLDQLHESAPPVQTVTPQH